jgi:hypothetical protein
MFFTRWSGQRIDTVFIFYRKVRPCSQLHRPDTEASQIAEVHLANSILQDEGRVRVSLSELFGVVLQSYLA